MDKIILAYDYVNNYTKKFEKMYTYVERRYDMYHILASTMVSIGLGLVIGFLYRFITPITWTENVWIIGGIIGIGFILEVIL